MEGDPRFKSRQSVERPPQTGNYITGEALNLLMSYPSSGNVSELASLVERCVVLGGKTITEECLPS